MDIGGVPTFDFLTCDYFLPYLSGCNGSSLSKKKSPKP